MPFVPGEFVKVDSGEGSVTPDFSYFTTDKAKIDNVDVTADEPKKRGRPPKNKDNVEFVSAKNTATMPYGTDSYLTSYNDTNMMLRGSIAQIDQLSGEIKTDIDAIRISKTLKNKYRYLVDLTNTSGGLIGTKVQAIGKINDVITKAHELDLKRMQQMKISEQDQNDDRRVLDLYNAFINTPVGSMPGMMPQQAIGPSIQDMTMLNGVPNMIRADIGEDQGYQQYLNNLTPEQNRIRLENNPNIQTVVVFNQDTGQRFFDVIDRSTGQSVPNVARPDPFMLDDITISVNNNTAKNTSLNQVYPLVVTGSGKLNEY